MSIEIYGNVGFDYQPAGKSDPAQPNYAKRQKDEYGLKVFADTKYFQAREQLLLESLNRGLTYWASPVQVTLAPLSETSISALGRAAYIKLGNMTIGELTAPELAKHPQILQNIEQGLAFRGAIEDDLIGYVLKIFTIYTGDI